MTDAPAGQAPRPTVGTAGEPAVPRRDAPRRGLTAGQRWQRFGVRVGVLYTVLTVISSTIALTSGQETDTHVHLLTRLVFVVIGLGAVELVDLVRRRTEAPTWLVVAVGYLVAIAGILLALRVYAATGGELHPDAERDALINVTAVAVGVSAVAWVWSRFRSRGR